jgi:hypothetical protein
VLGFACKHKICFFDALVKPYIIFLLIKYQKEIFNLKCKNNVQENTTLIIFESSIQTRRAKYDIIYIHITEENMQSMINSTFTIS